MPAYLYLSFPRVYLHPGEGIILNYFFIKGCMLTVWSITQSRCVSALVGVGDGGQDDVGESGSDLGSSFTSRRGESLERRRLLHADAGMAGQHSSSMSEITKNIFIYNKIYIASGMLHGSAFVHFESTSTTKQLFIRRNLVSTIISLVAYF